MEDINEAREAAYAEKAPRDFLTEHRSDLAEDQQKAMDWFATSEGEKALNNFRNEKEKTKNLVLQKVRSFFDYGEVAKNKPNSEDIKQINQIVKAFNDQEIEAVLSDENIKPSQKLTKLRNDAYDLWEGYRHQFHAPYGEKPDAFMERIKKEYQIPRGAASFSDLDIEREEYMNTDMYHPQPHYALNLKGIAVAILAEGVLVDEKKFNFIIQEISIHTKISRKDLLKRIIDFVPGTKAFEETLEKYGFIYDSEKKTWKEIDE